MRANARRALLVDMVEYVVYEHMVLFDVYEHMLLKRQ